VTLVLDRSDKCEVVTEGHAHVASAEQAEADKYPIGDPHKAEAMLRMKKVELAQRNVPGGFWVASTDPRAANHALTGEVPVNELRRALLMSDGAARLTDKFGLLSHIEALELVSTQGPQELLRQVRAAEAQDPDGRTWPRNKKSDDATIVFCDFTGSGFRPPDPS